MNAYQINPWNSRV